MLSHFFDSEGFMPHGMCLLWRPDLLVLHALSDTLIGAAYYSIPVSLIYFAMKRRDVEFRWVFALFGVFILACGTTHFLSVWTLWHPDYIVDGGVKALTAAVSILTACALWQIMPTALAIPGKQELELLNRDLETQVTVRRAAEASMRQLNADLERRVSERTRELELANADLKREIAERTRAEEQLRQAQKMEAVGQLTGGIAHDFNNLLAVIIGNLELIEDGVKGNAELLDITNRSRHAAQRGAELTQRLLSFARRQSLNPATVDVGAVIGGMNHLLRRTIGPQIAVDLRTDPAAGQASVDQSFLESAILNLVLNARDATPTGGRITVELAHARLDEARPGPPDTVPPGDYVTIAVMDTGTGMPPDVAARAFDPFFTTKEVGKGSGLGLSMVYGFVRQSNGYVTLASTPGGGTTARLYLPRVGDAPAASQAADRPGHNIFRGRGVVLVVEDEPEVRNLVVRAVRRFGFEVHEAADGAAALRLLSRLETIDVLLTDVALPGGMSGYDIARTAQTRQAHVKILYMSGYADPANPADDKAVPSHRLIRKPFTREQLGDFLSEALRA